MSILVATLCERVRISVHRLCHRLLRVDSQVGFLFPVGCNVCVAGCFVSRADARVFPQLFAFTVTCILVMRFNTALVSPYLSVACATVLNASAREFTGSIFSSTVKFGSLFRSAAPFVSFKRWSMLLATAQY